MNQQLVACGGRRLPPLHWTPHLCLRNRLAGLLDELCRCGKLSNVDTLESAISTITKRERYGYCAKCLKPKPVSTDYVCHDCVGTPGRYAGCAVCGLAMG